MTTYILLKSRPSVEGTAQHYEAVQSVLALALFVPASRISAPVAQHITKTAVRYNPHSNQADSPDLPLWHYRNWVKGFRFGEVWTIDAQISSDKMLIKSFKDLYGGLIDDENYDTVKSFVQLRTQLNSLREALRVADYRLFLIEPSERSYIMDTIKSRLDSVQSEVDKYPTNLLKRRF